MHVDPYYDRQSEPMSFASLFRVDLRRLIVVLAIFSGLIMLSISFYSSYQVQRESLIQSTLEANRAYAVKLAVGTEGFFATLQQQLGYSARILAERFDADTLGSETERLRLQTNSFNSVVVTDANGIIRAVSPTGLALVGHTLDSPGAREALRERRPLISNPYVSAIGTLVISVSQPIVDKQGTYLGYVGGIISLKEPNILSSMLGEHFYKDGSYLYAVDQRRRLLYHPDPQRVGTLVGENTVIDRVISGESGSQRVINSQGQDMLAGFAAVPTARWGIVAQRPTAATLHPLDGLMLQVLRQTTPLALLTFLGVWLLSGLISRPLWQLAKSAGEMDAPTSAERIQRIRSWYFEAAQLKRALKLGINLLHQRIGKLHLDAQTDPLTGLYNRRGLSLALEALGAADHSFAVVALDIDHFKRINDNHGHDVGDQVIRHLAHLMAACSRDADVLCRSGGEEFLMLLPNTNIESALRVAERLRLCVEQDEVAPVGHITISLGIAVWPSHHADVQRVLKLADGALYRAKQHGRNRSEIADLNTAEPGEG